MSYVLIYEEDGKKQRHQFSSYYECVKEKENLRKNGVNSRIVDNSKKVYPCKRIKLGVNGKKEIRDFLNRCKKNIH